MTAPDDQLPNQKHTSIICTFANKQNCEQPTMFTLRGKYLVSRYYARKVPLISRYVYEMSFVKSSSIFYKTIPFRTRIITLDCDLLPGYTHRLQKYIRQAESVDLTISRPEEISDIVELYKPIMEAKSLGSLPQGVESKQENYFYSEIHHPELGRLATHISIGDWDEKMVFGLVNASEYRRFPEKMHQRLCSIANKYLFHRDMEFFRDAGYKYYDMVGISEPVNQLKKEFGGQILMTYTHIPRVWVFLQSVKKMLKQSNQK